MINALEYFSILAARNQRNRKILADNADSYMRPFLMEAINTQEKFDEIKNKLNGETDYQDLKYEDVLDCIARNNLEPHRNDIVRSELEEAKNMSFLLKKRNWCVISANDSSGGFITSDQPVCTVWEDSFPQAYIPGPALLDATVFIPVSRKICLAGKFNDSVQESPIVDMQVHFINTWIIATAFRQVYAFDDSFKYLSPTTGKVEPGSKLATDSCFFTGPEQTEDEPD